MGILEMTDRKILKTTAPSIPTGGWRRVEQFRDAVNSPDTRGPSNASVVLVQGRYIKEGPNADKLLVTVDPAAIDRKIAIRQLNDRLEGRTPRSDTVGDVSARR